MHNDNYYRNAFLKQLNKDDYDLQITMKRTFDTLALVATVFFVLLSCYIIISGLPFIKSAVFKVMIGGSLMFCSMMVAIALFIISKHCQNFMFSKKALGEEEYNNMITYIQVEKEKDIITEQFKVNKSAESENLEEPIKTARVKRL